MEPHRYSDDNKRIINDVSRIIDYCFARTLGIAHPYDDIPASPVAQWLSANPDYTNRVEFFYRGVLDRLQIQDRAQCIFFEDHTLELHQLLTEKGVSVVDMLAAEIEMKDPEFTGLRNYFPLIDTDCDGENIDHFMIEVSKLDAVYEKTLSLPSFIIHRSRESGLAFKDPGARLFTFLLATEGSIPYLAHSELARRCMKSWLNELGHMQGEFIEWAGSKVFDKFHKEAQEITEALKPKMRKLFLDISEGFSSINLSNHQALSDFELKGKTCFDALGFLPEDRIKIGTHWLSTLSQRLGLEGMRALFEYPDQFAEALTQAAASKPMMEAIFSHTLHDFMYQHHSQNLDIGSLHTSTDSFQHLFSLILRHRIALIGANYADIKGSQLLRGITFSLNAAEAFERLGFLPREDMAMGKYFCPRGNDQLISEESLAAAKVRKMELAIKLGQDDLILAAVKAVFAYTQDLENSLATKEAIVHLAESNWPKIGKAITKEWQFKALIEMGASTTLMMQSPALAEFAETALEVDLGL